MIELRLQLEQVRDNIVFGGQVAVRSLDATTRHLQRAAGLQANAPAITTEDTGAMIRRIRQSVALGQLDDLVSRDARFAMRSFVAFPPAEIEALLGWYPRGWPLFVNALMGSKTSSGVPARWAEWSALARKAPPEIELLHGQIPVDMILSEDPLASARGIARRFDGLPSLANLESTLCRPGMFRFNWPFTALIFAAWVERQESKWSSIWKEVTSETLYEAWLLPRDARQLSRFAPHGEGLPAGSADDVGAQALFASAALRHTKIYSEGTDDSQELLASIWLQKDAFDDPRTFPDPRQPPAKNVGWTRVQTSAPREYAAFVERLIAADVELFFNQVEFAPDRRDFWLQYKKQIVRTSFCFQDSTRKSLEAKLAGTPSFESVRRARTLYGNVEAFCLVFPSRVVVEFSVVGNAAFFYDPKDFEQNLPKTGLVLMSHLKKLSVGKRMPHLPAQGWEWKFRQELSRWNIR